MWLGEGQPAASRRDVFALDRFMRCVFCQELTSKSAERVWSGLTLCGACLCERCDRDDLPQKEGLEFINATHKDLPEVCSDHDPWGGGMLSCRKLIHHGARINLGIPAVPWGSPCRTAFLRRRGLYDALVEAGCDGLWAPPPWYSAQQMTGRVRGGARRAVPLAQLREECGLSALGAVARRRAAERVQEQSEKLRGEAVRDGYLSQARVPSLLIPGDVGMGEQWSAQLRFLDYLRDGLAETASAAKGGTETAPQRWHLHVLRRLADSINAVGAARVAVEDFNRLMRERADLVVEEAGGAERVEWLLARVRGMDALRPRIDHLTAADLWEGRICSTGEARRAIQQIRRDMQQELYESVTMAAGVNLPRRSLHGAALCADPTVAAWVDHFGPSAKERAHVAFAAVLSSLRGRVWRAADGPSWMAARRVSERHCASVRTCNQCLSLCDIGIQPTFIHSNAKTSHMNAVKRGSRTFRTAQLIRSCPEMTWACVPPQTRRNSMYDKKKVESNQMERRNEKKTRT